MITESPTACSIPPQMFEDDAILSQIRLRHETGLAALITRYGGAVRGLCNSIIIDPLEADSVTSDVFLEIWNRHASFNPERGSLRTYLMTLARSRCIDRIRARTAQNRKLGATSLDTGVNNITTAEEPTGRILAQELNETIQCALQSLPEKQRKALELAFFAGMTHSQVADVMEMPLGTIKTNIRTGLLRLRTLLVGEYEES